MYLNLSYALVMNQHQILEIQVDVLQAYLGTIHQVQRLQKKIHYKGGRGGVFEPFIDVSETLILQKI